MNKKVKIVAISDIHGELLGNLPKGDILTISGDICPVRMSHSPTSQQYWLYNYFLPWCKQLISKKTFKHIVFIAGNHDFVFYKALKTHGDIFKNHKKEYKNIHYLSDSEITLMGVRIYGTPWAPKFGDWAFMHSEEVLNNYFSKIPEGLDILLSHGPAYYLNDTIMQYPDRTSGRDPHIGSKSLREHIKRAKPQYLLVGHIHSGNHECQDWYTDYEELNSKITKSYNVSLMDEDYVISYKPFQFILEK